jgi:phosphoglycerate dehydrogenase-like enzyme
LSRNPLSVLINFDLPTELVEEIASLSPRLAVRQEICVSARQVEALLAEGGEVLYARPLPERLEEAWDLRWVQVQYAGVDGLLDHPLFRSNILVTTTSGAHAVPSAEYVIGVMIALFRAFPALVRDQALREWNRAHSPERELHGKTLLILGYGSIGREVARLAQAFNMRILAVKRDPVERQDIGFALPGTGDPDGALPERIVGPEGLLDVLTEADFVVSTVALTRDTRHILGERALRAMKPSAFLINVSRGGICHEPSLLRALSERWIAGAALDVFDEEPLPAHSPFYGLPNVFVTPHISASRQNPAYDRRATGLFIENLRRYLDGRPLLNLVQRDRGY